MKNLLSILLFVCVQVNATNYYFAVSGNDSNPGSQAAPFKTLSKASSIGSPGDSVLFKGGDTFYGGLTCRSGVNYGSYGGKAIIEGFTTLQGFVQSGNIYSLNLSTQTYMVIVDGKFKPYGRSPKTGYYNCTASGTNTITGNFSGNYVGGEVVWRPYHWVLWRGMVSGQSGSTVTYQPFASTSGGSVYPAKVGWGLFFQNNPALCTQLGEWSSVGTKFSIWLDQHRVVRAAQIQNLITINSLSNVSISNLILQGANGDGIYMPNSKNTKIINVDIFFCGKNFIEGNVNCSSNSITGCTMDRANFNGIVCQSGPWTITNNSLSNIAYVSGMGGSGEGQYLGISNANNGSKITGNIIKNVGYNGINFGGMNNLIQYNSVDSFCTVKDDGGGIYFGGFDNSGTKILNNVLTNGIGIPDGTPDKNDPRAHGIYADDGARNVEFAGNICAFNTSGFYSHDSYNLNIHDNQFIDNKQQGIKYYNNGNTIAGITLVNNIVYSHSNVRLSYASGGSNSVKNYFKQADFNYWNPGKVFVTSTSYDLPGWQSFTAKEASSKTIAVNSTTRFEYNPTSQSKIIALNGTYQDVKGVPYSGSITLAPYTGVLLMQTSAPPPTTYLSQALSQSMSTTCTNGSGISATYSVPANKYSSTLSQADANAKAKSEIDQWWANMINNCGCKN